MNSKNTIGTQDDNRPLVTVVVITYNHVDNIARCLDSILAQRTNFSFQVLVIDDASTDGSTDVIREYAARDARIIPIIHEHNYYSKGRDGFVEAMDRIDTKYFHRLESDDYWCNENKLQLQVDALEAHPECSICGHACEYRDAEGAFLEIRKMKAPLGFRIRNIFNTQFCHLSTSLCRNFLPELSLDDRYFISRDINGFYYWLTKGDLYYLDKTMSVCRRTGVGIWSSLPTEQQKMALQELYYKLDRKLDFRYTKKFRHRYLPDEGKDLWTLRIPLFWKGHKLKISFKKI